MKLDEYIKKVGLTPGAFARLCDVQGQTIVGICTGKRLPSKKTIKKIMKYCNGEVTMKDFGYG